ncbi:metal ABC transporter solute-binding protein, Zn/Mn family [Bacillus daqingensis]|uniref:Metal ABC transporter solute-binding protein, Zn/Mn family n=1 Tax=Bacillus daqingensis TaxID=872396 RepID=A0ABV9NV64_9BACI
MRKTKLSAIVLSAVFLAACGNNEAAENNTNNAEENNNSAATNEEENEAAENQDPITVKTTLFPLEYFAQEIGGDYVEVENIVPAGADAHTFEPSSSQMIDIAEADLFIYNGVDFEGFTESVQDAVDGQNVEMVTASEGIDLISYSHGIDDDHDHDHDDNDHGHNHDDNNDDHDHDDNNHGHNHDDNNDDHDHDHDDNDHGHNHDDNNDDHDHDHDDNNHGHNHDDNNDDHDHDHDHDHSHGDEDPHVWLDPKRAAEQAENIKNALSEANPDAADTFEENYEELLTQFEELDEQFVELSDNMTQDIIVVSHAGYGYWEEEYGIRQLGIAGLSPSNEPSIQQMEETIEFMEDNDINYVMFEQNIPENITETVREQVGAESLELHNLESLTEEEEAEGASYFTIMEQNLETLNTALR